MERTLKLTFFIILLILTFVIFNGVVLHCYGEEFDKDLYNFIWKFNLCLSLFLAYITYAFFNMLIDYRYPTGTEDEDFE